DVVGDCGDEASEDDDEDIEDPDDLDQVEANEAAGKEFPLAHRCLDSNDRSSNYLLEAVRNAPHKANMRLQTAVNCGLDISYLAMNSVSMNMIAPCIEVPCGEEGRVDIKLASSLPPEFKIFRHHVCHDEEVKKRGLKLDRRVALALRLNPSYNTSATGAIFKDKQGSFEILETEYRVKLRHRFQVMSIPVAKADLPGEQEPEVETESAMEDVISKEIELYASLRKTAGCVKATSANVEQLFSNSGALLSDYHANKLGNKLMEAYMMIRGNWKYEFLRPSAKEIGDRYKAKYGELEAVTVEKGDSCTRDMEE
ncbi:hypothetical protein CYMTET_6410, partial [Cymbomonas tetramitiformis]